MISLEEQLRQEHERAELYKLKLDKLARLEAETQRRDSLPHLYLHKRYNFQQQFEAEVERRIQIICACNQVGKAQCITTPMFTTKGWTTLGELSVGDHVFGRNGQPTSIVAIPYEGVREGYRFHFADGTTIDSSEEHLWVCKGRRQRFQRWSRGKKEKASDFDQWVVRSTKEIYDIGKYAKNNAATDRFVIPFNEPLELPAQKVFDPYAMGLLLGDGSLGKYITFLKPDDFINDYLVTHYAGVRRKSNAIAFSVASEIHAAINSYGLIGKKSENKFIPAEYFLGSVEQRIALLRGLMDTDGTVCPEGDTVEFNSASALLADGVAELVRSLGGHVIQKTKAAGYKKDGILKKCLDTNLVRIKMPTINPFLTPVKANLWRGDIRYRHERVIRKIEKIGPIACRCLTVDNSDSTFIAGKNYVVTHNSSAAIQRVIDLATAKEKWAEYWPDTIEKGQVPAQWWYLYPSMEVATVEFEEKWKPLLPKNKHDPVYGWEIHLGKGGYVRVLSFKSGINVYFKSYEQSAKNLQSGSVYLLVGDEELPVHLLPELQMRVNATKGYMWFVFTATLGQNWWKEVVEDKKRWAKEARIWQVSLYDCQKYADGTPSKWTNKAIEETIAKCTTPAEVQRRVFGRFVRDEGLVFASFDRERHVIPYRPVPSTWVTIAGIDYGSGGNKGHPSSIVVIAVNPERTEAKVIRAWRGEGRVTTCKDVVEEYIKIADGLDKVDYVYYDFSAKDLATFAQAAGLAFTQADKDRTVGIGLVNTLFKTNRLLIMHSGGDAQYAENIADEHMMGFQLADELAALSVDTPKKAARDDLCIEENQRVAAERGWVPIKDLRVGERVWTRGGLRQVLRVIPKGQKDVVNFNGLWMTPDHQVMSMDGCWVENRHLAKTGQMPYSLAHLWHKRLRQLFSTGSNIGATRNQKTRHTSSTSLPVKKTSLRALAIYIGTFGSSTMVIFPLAFMSIIKTATFLIMTSVILSVLTAALILKNTCASAWLTLKHWLSFASIFKKPLRQPLSGIAEKMDASGTKPTGKKLLAKMLVGSLKEIAITALLNIKQIILPSLVEALGFAQISAKVLGVENLDSTTWNVIALSAVRFSLLTDTPKPKNAHGSVKANVYDIEVDGFKEFFAESILCKNCDSLRYAIIAAGFDWDIINQHGENLDAENATRQVKVKVLSIDDLRRDGEKMWAEAQNEAMSAEGELEFWQNQMESI